MQFTGQDETWKYSLGPFSVHFDLLYKKMQRFNINSCYLLFTRDKVALSCARHWIDWITSYLCTSQLWEEKKRSITHASAVIIFSPCMKRCWHIFFDGLYEYELWKLALCLCCSFYENFLRLMLFSIRKNRRGGEGGEENITETVFCIGKIYQVVIVLLVLLSFISVFTYIYQYHLSWQ